MFKKTVMLLVLSLALSASVHAEKWFPVGQATDGSLVSLDLESIALYGKKAAAWISVQYPDKTIGIVLEGWHCDNATSKIYEIAIFSNSSLVGHTVFQNSKWEPITTGSINDDMRNKACVIGKLKADVKAWTHQVQPPEVIQKPKPKLKSSPKPAPIPIPIPIPNDGGMDM